jgi:two-component sensor histidine kinase
MNDAESGKMFTTTRLNQERVEPSSDGELVQEQLRHRATGQSGGGSNSEAAHQYSRFPAGRLHHLRYRVALPLYQSPGRTLCRQTTGSVTRDLLSLIRQAVAEQQGASKRHQLVLKTRDAHLPVRGNATRLDRVLTNLLGNAMKYSPKGGEITIEVTQEEQEGRSWVVLSIQDQGVGIPEADLPHIFEPFHRASNVTGRIQGTGVGRASVAQVIEQHQGTISVISEEGKGSCFIVRIPLLSTPYVLE